MIEFLILCAGRGTRMGQPKWHVKWYGKTLLERILHTIQRTFHTLLPYSVRYHITLLFSTEEKNIPSNLIHPNTHILQVPPSPWMFSTIRYALLHTHSCASTYIIWPVDTAAFSSPDLSDIICEWIKKPHCAVMKPYYGIRGGHPLIISASLIPRILEFPSDFPGGLQRIIRMMCEPPCAFHVRTPHCTWNLNRKDDLIQYRPGELF